MRSLNLLIAFTASVFCFSCSDSQTHEPPLRPDTETDTSSESSSNGIDSDSGETEIPPDDLLDDCTGDDGGVNIVFNDVGDSETPTAAKGNGTIVAWSGDLKEGEYPQWHIRLASYTPQATEIISNAPMTATILAEKPSIASNGDSFGLIWLDAQWDLSCEPALLDSCKRDLAFMIFDETGKPLNTVPIRITNENNIKQRASIAPTTNGWLVVWSEATKTNAGTVRAISISLDGTAGEAFDVSEPGQADVDYDVSIASLGDTAVAVWLASDQQSIFSRKLNQNGSITGDIIVIDENIHISRPVIVAGSGEYLMSMGRKVSDDFEIYTVLLDDDGNSKGPFNRATWTTIDITESAVAWSGTEYGLVWLSDRDNGALQPWKTNAEQQVFFALLNSDATPSTSAVMISEDLNSASEVDLLWDGFGWTAFWELPGANRTRIFRGRVICANNS